jgi:DNA modification methylase
VREATEVRLFHCDSAAMAELGSGEAALVITGPPYFDTATERLLAEPVARQLAVDDVQRRLICFAQSLRPVFEETARILHATGTLVVQTKDIRYGGVLLGLADVHRSMLEVLGFRLLTAFHWFDAARERRRGGRAVKLGRVGDFRAISVEQFMVFSRSPQVSADRPLTDVSETEGAKWQQPLWSSPGPGARQIHPHESPEEPLRRLISLYSAPGDLVVDPFAGGATVLRVARSLGRRAFGFEVNPTHYAAGQRRLK